MEVFVNIGLYLDIYYTYKKINFLKIGKNILKTLAILHKMCYTRKVTFFLEYIYLILKIYTEEEERMCKIADYPGLYSRANELLRREGISPQVPGYELLRKAIVTQKVEGKVSLEEISKGMVIPSNKDINLEKKNRTAEMQWMIEAVRSIGVEDESDANPEETLNRYIQQLAFEIGP